MEFLSFAEVVIAAIMSFERKCVQSTEKWGEKFELRTEKINNPVLYGQPWRTKDSSRGTRWGASCPKGTNWWVFWNKP